MKYFVDKKMNHYEHIPIAEISRVVNLLDTLTYHSDNFSENMAEWYEDVYMYDSDKAEQECDNVFEAIQTLKDFVKDHAEEIV